MILNSFSGTIQTAMSRIRKGDPVVQLISINVGLFILITLLKVFFTLMGIAPSMLIDWLALPSDLTELEIRPWTLFSYMFIHEGFFHLLFNMLCLYWFGELYASVYSKRELIWVYLCGGICAGLIYMAAYNLFPYFDEVGRQARLVGASGSIMTLTVSVAFRIPNREMTLMLLGNIKMKYLVCGLVVIDLLSVTGSNAGGHFAHLGGALLGVLQFVATQNRYSLFSPLLKVQDYLSNLFKPRPKENNRVKFHRPKSTGRGRNTSETKQAKPNGDKRLEEILERLKNSGYGALSKEDREYLFRANNNK